MAAEGVCVFQGAVTLQAVVCRHMVVELCCHPQGQALSPERHSFLITAGDVKSCSCRGFIPAVISVAGGQEECSPSHPFLRFPCRAFVGGEEAAWG